MKINERLIINNRKIPKLTAFNNGLQCSLIKNTSSLANVKYRTDERLHYSAICKN